MIIHGLTEEAMNYLYENSPFSSYKDKTVKPIGCKQSDGYSSLVASLYKTEKLKSGELIYLFEYELSNDLIIKEVIDYVKDENIFICLEINGVKKYKWKK